MIDKLDNYKRDYHLVYRTDVFKLVKISDKIGFSSDFILLIRHMILLDLINKFSQQFSLFNGS